MPIGILNQKAPELRVAVWIDGDGRARQPLSLADLGEGHKVLYCFQHWCPGCHSSGFPTLKRLVNGLSDRDFGFAVIQTVFEGDETNTVNRLRETQERYSLKLPFGHDPAPTGERRPTVMADYETGGTPWFIVIGPDGDVIYNDFRLNADQLLKAFDGVTSAA